jgi:TonB-dependent SusC/RagA subfamily outer membrane receptor
MATAEQGLPHFPGVDVIPLDHGAFEVKIHSRMVGDGPPLYVIDGRPLTEAPTRGIDWLRREDIVRIEVVKNPADIAIYGTRGVNGVVLITTRGGAKPR